VVELLFMRTIALEQRMQNLVVGIVTVAGLSPATVINHPYIMGTIILPAAVDSGGLRREMRVIFRQCFPEKLRRLPR
ncbi:hypothetical protein, partial [Xenorhabdus santafensis]|uniref:hypothetical protein n=1 Tax=Xenorhabdus santafensis TaxID=2582833 RepID=UPI0029E80544